MNSIISIIIVNYNSGELLLNCLKSINTELPTLDYEVVVVDNNSSDNSVEVSMEYTSNIQNKERYIFKILPKNEGFARGCNIGASLSKGEILHFLNPDTEFKEGMESDYKKVCCAKHNVYVNPLINSDGTIENSKMVLPTLRDIFWWNFKRAKARFWCRGASVIFSKENFIKLGGWSEDYFMYGEDLDLFYMFWVNKLKIKFLATPIFHLGGGCSRNVWNSFEREVRVQKSFKKFFEKHFNRCEYIMVKLYFLLHNLLKHPTKFIRDIKAWNKV